MKTFRISAIIAAFLLSTLPSTSSADNIEACKVPDTKNSAVSLGFPVKKERLNYISKPRVLVIPFHPSDAPSFSLSSEEKATFLQSAKDIYKLSSGSSQIEFVFNPTVKLAITSQDMDSFKIFVRETYLRDFENDQFGFALKFIQDNDPAIDYTGIDSVILYGFSFYRYQEIASALQFTSDMNFVGNSIKRKDGKPWFAPIVTDEKLISNVVLMYNRNELYVLTHELLHNYGLTDLYGAPNTPGLLSRMADGRSSDTLLTYEKWVLGWHSDKDVTCVSGSNSEMINKFVFDVRNKEQIALVRPNQSPYMYILETAIVRNDFLLSFYKLTNDARPPIEYYSYGSPKSTAGVNLADLNTIATIYKGDQFSVFIHSIKDSLATVYVYPNSASTSSEVLKLQAEAQAEAKIAIELRAKQEAEAKAAAEFKAKQEAEAKAAAELKAKQEAEAAALAAAAKSKKTTITCVKGKLTKKVTAVKPKCPAGYKRK